MSLLRKVLKRCQAFFEWRIPSSWKIVLWLMLVAASVQLYFWETYPIYDLMRFFSVSFITVFKKCLHIFFQIVATKKYTCVLMKCLTFKAPLKSFSNNLWEKKLAEKFVYSFIFGWSNYINQFSFKMLFFFSPLPPKK